MWACSFKYSLSNVMQHIANKMRLVLQKYSQTFVWRRAHNATIGHIFALFHIFFFSPAFSHQRFFLKMWLGKTIHCAISRGTYMEIFSSRCLDLWVAIFKVLCGRGRIRPRGSTDSIWPTWASRECGSAGFEAVIVCQDLASGSLGSTTLT